MTKETAQFLLNLVNAQTVTVAAPDFDDVVALILAARAELASILQSADTVDHQ